MSDDDRLRQLFKKVMTETEELTPDERDRRLDEVLTRNELKRLADLAVTDAVTRRNMAKVWIPVGLEKLSKLTQQEQEQEQWRQPYAAEPEFLPRGCVLINKSGVSLADLFGSPPAHDDARPSWIHSMDGTFVRIPPSYWGSPLAVLALTSAYISGYHSAASHQFESPIDGFVYVQADDDHVADLKQRKGRGRPSKKLDIETAFLKILAEQPPASDAGPTQYYDLVRLELTGTSEYLGGLTDETIRRVIRPHLDDAKERIRVELLAQKSPQ